MAGFVETPYQELIFNLPDSRQGVDYFDEDIDAGISLDEDLLRSEPIDIGNWDELTVIRHFIGLSQENFSVDTNFYPLGSCTMKYNPKVCEALTNNEDIINAHPHLISEGLEDKIQGFLELLWELEQMLCRLTGMSRFTFQPMAGANGEFCGIAIISAYHRLRGAIKRKNIIIPDAAHGTNPASATLGGFKTINIPTREKGYLTLNDIKPYLNNELAGLMLTSPNTLGIFNPEIRQIADAVHNAGGLLYYDGANFNALMGNVSVSKMGFDIVHLNLHKSFSTPHGSGGPGAGPVGVVEELVEFLPVPLVEKGNNGFYLRYGLKDSIGKIAPFLGNFTILLRAYIYLSMLGIEGCSYASKIAVLNANYLKAKLADLIDVPYNSVCMHEFVASAQGLKKEKGISALDIAKALIDYGIHPPTIYFPLIVNEALMIEPTETESKATLDYFISAISDILRYEGEQLKDCPRKTRISRPDEVKAARDLLLAE